MSVKILPPLTVRAWESDAIKSMILESQFEQISNRVIETQEVPNAGNKMAPKTIVHYVSDKFRDGVQYVTIPMVTKLVKKGVGGSQVAQGLEEKVKMRYAQVHYNVQRKPITFRDESVDGDLTKFYNLVEQRASLLKDYFAELNDYNKQRALTLKADEYLTKDEYWEGDSILAAPVKDSLHPNVLYPGQTALVTWSSTAATYAGNLVTALNSAFTSAATTMNKVLLERMIQYAKRNIRPIGKGAGFTHVIMVSESQADQLVSDNTAGGWYETFKDAAKRSMENRAITNYLGIHQGVLVLVNTRAPLFNCDTTFDGDWQDRFQFVKPWDEIGNDYWDEGDNRVPVIKGTGSGSEGTCEVAYILGAGAICGAKIKDITYRSEKQDYDFSEGFLGFQKCGEERTDLYNPADVSSGVSSTKPWNQSSALYFTPTPAVLI